MSEPVDNKESDIKMATIGVNNVAYSKESSSNNSQDADSSSSSISNLKANFFWFFGKDSSQNNTQKNEQTKNENKLDKISIEEKEELSSSDVNPEHMVDLVQENYVAQQSSPLFFVSQTETSTSVSHDENYSSDSGTDQNTDPKESKETTNSDETFDDQPTEAPNESSNTIENILAEPETEPASNSSSESSPNNSTNIPLPETCDVEEFSEEWEIMIGEITNEEINAQQNDNWSYEQTNEKLATLYNDDICAYYNDLGLNDNN